MTRTETIAKLREQAETAGTYASACGRQGNTEAQARYTRRMWDLKDQISALRAEEAS